MATVGDFNGDGKDNILYHGKCGSSTLCWRIHFSNGNAFSSGSNWGRATGLFSTETQTYGLKVGDFNNDGFDDVAYPGKCDSQSGSSNCWIFEKNTGSRFQTMTSQASWWFTSETADFGGLFVANLDQQEGDELMYVGKCGRGERCLRVHRVVNGQIQRPISWTNRMWPSEETGHFLIQFGDIDGDGDIDMGYRGKCGRGQMMWRYHQNNGSSLNSVRCSAKNLF